MQCSKCGSANEEKAKFCNSCGNPLIVVQPKVVSGVEPTPAKKDENATALDDDQRYQLIIPSREVMEKDILQSIRQRLNQWAKELPYHSFQDFGDTAEVLSLTELPVYRLVLYSQYETRRRIGGSQAPYRGEELPREVISKENLDVWKYPSEELTDFKMQRGTYTITDSRQVVNCLRCLGQKEEVCDRCNGKLKISCEKCEGRGKLPCPECKGRKEVYCWSCGGRGKVGTPGAEAACMECGGKGKEVCRSCQNGYLECDVCSNGLVTCSKCQGKGILLCNDCAGQGKILKFLCFDAEFTFKFDLALVSPNNLPAEISPENFKDYTKAKKIFEKETKQFLPTVDNFKSLMYREVKEAIFSLIEKSALPISPDNQTRIVKQKLLLQKFGVFQLNYRYHEKNYQLWFYDGLKQIFAQDSPFREVYQQIFFSAEEKFRQKNYLESLDLLEKVAAVSPEYHNQARPRIIEIRKIINREYVGGALLGSGVSLFVYVLSVFIFKKGSLHFFFPILGVALFTLLLAGGLGVGCANGAKFFSAKLSGKLKGTFQRVKFSALISLGLCLSFYLLFFWVLGFEPVGFADRHSFWSKYRRHFSRGLPARPDQQDLNFFSQLIQKYEPTGIDLKRPKNELAVLTKRVHSLTVQACNEDIKYYNWAVTHQRMGKKERIEYLEKIIKKYRDSGVNLSSLGQEIERLKN